MKKQILILLFLCAGLLFNNYASADLVNPDYVNRHCRMGEVEKICSYESATPYGPAISSDCAQYKNIPTCYYLDVDMHSFGGTEKYCCFSDYSDATSAIHSIVMTLLTLLLTVLIELPVFWCFGFKNKEEIKTIILANTISVFSFAFASLMVNGLLFVLIFEIAIVIFEIWFLKRILKTISIKKIIFATITANIISATLGSFIMVWGVFIFNVLNNYQLFQ
jgi:hypothetical protein